MENEASKRLICALKVIGANIRTLHRNLKGGNWFSDHELLAKYYEEVDELEDSVVETLMFLGNPDVSMADAVRLFKVLEVKDYNAYEAFSIVRVYFKKLIEMFDAVKESVPADVASKFEEYQYNLRLEADYKLARFLADKTE